MRIIGLKGKTNSGKTSTLKYLMMKMLEIEGIKPIYASRHFSADSSKLRDNIDNNWNTPKGKVSNISIVLKYKDKIICITSFGDSLKYEILPILDRTIRQFGHCDVFVCARHKNNDLKQEFKNYSPIEITEEEKKRSSNSNNNEKENKKSAQVLLGMVCKQINILKK